MKKSVLVGLSACLVFVAASLVFPQQPSAKRPVPASAQPPTTFPLWANGAPGALGHADEDIPTLTYYPALHGVPTAVIVAPGGGYGALELVGDRKLAATG